MSTLPEGAILTTIDGRIYMAVLRNITSTVDDGPVLRPTNTPSPIPSDPPEGELPSVLVTSTGVVFITPLPDSSTSSSPTSPVATPSDVAAAAVATDTGENDSDGVPQETPSDDDDDDDDDDTATALDVLGAPARETPQENNAVLPTRSQETADAATSITANPTPTAEARVEEQEEVDGIETDNVPEETTAGSGDDNEFDDESATRGGTNGDSKGAIITPTLEDGLMTTIPSDSPDSPTLIPDSDVVDGSNDGTMDPRKAGVVVGAVVGAAVAAALVAFFLWFSMKRRQRPRYIIHTPVFKSPNSGSSGKTWEFDADSLGPTPRSERILEAMGNKFNNIGKIFKPTSSPPRGESTVSMDRGHPQFLEPAPRPEKGVSPGDAAVEPGPRELSTKDRLGDWWSRVREDADFNWRLRNDEVADMSRADGGGAAMARGVPGRMSSTRRASFGSTHDVSGALGLTLTDSRARGNDPFSDTHAIRQNPPQPSNPFDDAHQSIAPPPQAAYGVRGDTLRPRGSTTASMARRELAASFGRSNVRSDQFDLEIDPHPGTRIRGDSLTSRVSSLRNCTEPAGGVSR